MIASLHPVKMVATALMASMDSLVYANLLLPDEHVMLRWIHAAPTHAIMMLLALHPLITESSSARVP